MITIHKDMTPNAILSQTGNLHLSDAQFLICVKEGSKVCLL